MSSGSLIKITVLIWLTLQNAVHALLIRYSRVREVPEMYFSTVAVFWTEVIKIIACVLMITQETDGLMRFFMKFLNSEKRLNNSAFSAFALIKQQVFGQPRDTMKVCIPAILYTLQNNLFYTAANHLNAATFMVLALIRSAFNDTRVHMNASRLYPSSKFFLLPFFQ